MCIIIIYFSKIKISDVKNLTISILYFKLRDGIGSRLPNSKLKGCVFDSGSGQKFYNLVGLASTLVNKLSLAQGNFTSTKLSDTG